MFCLYRHDREKNKSNFRYSIIPEENVKYDLYPFILNNWFYHNKTTSL